MLNDVVIISKSKTEICVRVTLLGEIFDLGPFKGESRFEDATAKAKSMLYIIHYLLGPTAFSGDMEMVETTTDVVVPSLHKGAEPFGMVSYCCGICTHTFKHELTKSKLTCPNCGTDADYFEELN